VEEVHSEPGEDDEEDDEEASGGEGAHFAEAAAAGSTAESKMLDIRERPRRGLRWEFADRSGRTRRAPR